MYPSDPESDSHGSQGLAVSVAALLAAVFLAGARDSVCARLRRVSCELRRPAHGREANLCTGWAQPGPAAAAIDSCTQPMAVRRCAPLAIIDSETNEGVHPFGEQMGIAAFNLAIRHAFVAHRLEICCDRAEDSSEEVASNRA